jgi:predicted transcriptional regulator
MSADGLSSQVRDFVIRHITSVEQLELLLLLASDPSKGWTIHQLVKEISSSQESVSQRLKQLAEDRFLTKAGEIFRFAPAAPEKVAVISELANAYRLYRVRITELIYSRAGVLKTFSDAFKLR